MFQVEFGRHLLEAVFVIVAALEAAFVPHYSEAAFAYQSLEAVFFQVVLEAYFLAFELERR